MANLVAELGTLARLLERGQYRQLVEASSRILDAIPDQPDALFMLGTARAELGEHEQARSLLERVLALDPGRLEVHYNLGVICTQMGDPEAARAHYEALCQSNAGHRGATYNLAVLHMQAREWQRAEALLGPLIGRDPQFAPAQRAMAQVQEQLGQSGLAISWLESSLRLQRDAGAYGMLGRLQQQLGNWSKALACYRNARASGGAPELELAIAEAALVLGEDELALSGLDTACSLGLLNQDYWRLRAALCRRQDDQEAALVCYTRALECPGGEHRRELLANRGTCLMELERFDEARSCYEQALALNAESADLHYNLGVLDAAQGDLQAARAAYERALALDGTHLQARNNLGLLCKRSGDADGAQWHFEQVLAQAPDHLPALLNLGNLLVESGEGRAARQLYEQALQQNAEHPSLLVNIANLEREQGNLAAAQALYQRALASNHQHAEAHFGCATCALLQADWHRGWREYRWRLGAGRVQRPELGLRDWAGPESPARRLLVCAEQGLGDCLQFLPLLAEARRRWPGIALGLRLRPVLIELVRSSFALDDVEILAADDAAVDWSARFDAQCMLLDMPRHLELALDSPPLAPPWVQAPRTGLGADVRSHPHWADERRWRIGLCWRGNPHHSNDRNRSMAIGTLVSLFEGMDLRDAVCWVNLQRDPGEDERTWLQQQDVIDDQQQLARPEYSAALIARLDLVISVDTFVAHLAGALDCPVWILIPRGPDWRWGLDRSDVPWYPRARLWRQDHPRDWESLLERMRRTLHEILRGTDAVLARQERTHDLFLR